MRVPAALRMGKRISNIEQGISNVAGTAGICFWQKTGTGWNSDNPPEKGNFIIRNSLFDIRHSFPLII
jgi:hypothetical protein